MKGSTSTPPPVPHCIASATVRRAGSRHTWADESADSVAWAIICCSHERGTAWSAWPVPRSTAAASRAHAHPFSAQLRAELQALSICGTTALSSGCVKAMPRTNASAEAR
eukprot:scaffold6285_cov121-Isochrysis_galbana.AAC.12